MIILKKIRQYLANYFSLEVVLMENGEIKAVHNSDLEAFLKSIDEYEKVVSGDITCFFCHKIITLENIQSIFPYKNEVQYCCKEDPCYKLLLERGKIDA